MNTEKLLRLAQRDGHSVVLRYKQPDGMERQTKPSQVVVCDAFGVALTREAPSGAREDRFLPYHEITLVHPVVGDRAVA